MRLNEWSLNERSRSEREKEEKEEAQGVREERRGFVAIQVVQRLDLSLELLQ